MQRTPHTTQVRPSQRSVVRPQPHRHTPRSSYPLWVGSMGRMGAPTIGFTRRGRHAPSGIAYAETWVLPTRGRMTVEGRLALRFSRSGGRL